MLHVACMAPASSGLRAVWLPHRADGADGWFPRYEDRPRVSSSCAPHVAGLLAGKPCGESAISAGEVLVGGGGMLT